MPLTTAQDLVDFALRIASVNGVGQTPAPSDESDCLLVANMLLTEWQLNRWLVPDLVSATFISTGAASYTVGSGGNFALSQTGFRPDRIDAAVARLTATGVDTFLYPFMSREGYARTAQKTLTGQQPEAYFYDAANAANGVLYFYPAPDTTWTMIVTAKADLGQFATLASPLSMLPPQHQTALVWNLAERIRPLYGMQPRDDISRMAASSLVAIGGAGAQMVQAQQPVPSARAGNYSHVAPQAAS